jgi:hypothetical protein
LERLAGENRLERKMNFKIIAVSAGFALLTASAGFAATLTTTFAGGNRLAGNMFDVSVTGPAQTIRSVEVNTEGTGSVDLFLYTRSGTFVGSEATSVGWTLLDTGTVTGQGEDTATAWDLADFTLGAGSLTGFYIGIGNYANNVNNMQYTTGTNVGDVLATDGVLTIFEGVGKGDGFSRGTFTTRNWNGSLIYDNGSISAVPLPAAGWLLFASLGGLVAARRKRS